MRKNLRGNGRRKMKMTWFARPAKFKLRMLLMLLGVSLQGLGLSLLIRINFGTDPCSALTQGVIAHVPLSFGTAQVLCHMINFIIVMRYDMSRIGFGTIGNMGLFRLDMGQHCTGALF